MPRSKSGTVYERRAGVWECRVTVAGVKSASTVHGTEADAWAEVRRMESELGGVPALGRDATLADVWAAYSAVRLPKLAAKTRNNYVWHMENLVLPAFGERPAWAITRPDVQRAMLTPGWTRDRAKRFKTTLSAVLTWAASMGYVTTNPIREGGFELPEDTDALDELDECDDPFAAIDGARDVWDAQMVMDAMPRLRGCPLEPCWLACVGAGLRVEEALALRKADVRRIPINGRMVTQVAVHHALPDVGGRKGTKTPRSVRVLAVTEPFGLRLSELADALPDRADRLCPIDPSNQNRTWRLYFDAPPSTWHPRMSESRKAQGRLYGLPYLPMGRMRATHSTLMQEAGVMDSVNAAYHGHSEKVAYSNYQRPDTTDAAALVGSMLERLD